VQQPASLRAAVAVTGLEAVLIAAAAGVLLLDVATGEAGDALAPSVLLAALAAAAAAGLAVAARGLSRGHGWARAPLLVWQLLQGAVALPALRGGAPWLWALLAVLAVGGFVALVAPTTSHALDR